MSSQLRQCRQGLAKALGEAANHLPEVTYGPATISGPGPVHYVPRPHPPHPPELLHHLCLALTAHNPVLTQHRADCGQGPRHDLEGYFTVSDPEPEHQDLPAQLGPSMKTLDELMAKLEFENELNRVCNRLSLNVNAPPARGDSTGSADSGVDVGALDEEEDEEDVRLTDMVLDMEQDYKHFVY